MRTRFTTASRLSDAGAPWLEPPESNRNWCACVKRESHIQNPRTIRQNTQPANSEVEDREPLEPPEDELYEELDEEPDDRDDDPELLDPLLLEDEPPE